MNSTRLEFLFQRYRSGSSTREEELELMEIINKNDNPHLRKLLTDLWNDISEKLPEDKAEHIINSILNTSGNVVPLYKKRYTWLKTAAVTGLIALSATALYQLINSPLAQIRSESTAELPQQHQFVKLPDGSKVILNHNSKLEYPPSFENTNVRYSVQQPAY